MSAAIFRFPVRVYYEDTDASGVAYHANYLRWFERARTEWLRGLGFEQLRLHEQLGAVFTVASLQLEYRRPARLDDALEVEVRVPSARRASLIFEQILKRPADSTLLATASVKVGCVDAERFKPVAVPQRLRDAIETWARSN